MTTLTGKTKVVGVIGYPITDSLFLRLHAYWLRRHGIDSVYITMPVRTGGLVRAATAIAVLGLVGFKVIIGAGGAARAVCANLFDGGVPEARLINRTRSKAVALASDLCGNVEPVPWESLSQALADAALLVNATTLGMVGNPPLDRDLGPLPRKLVVADIVYIPLRTSLLGRASERGNPVVDGLKMLLHQARPGFAAWFGIEPEMTPEQRAFVFAGMVR